MKAIYGKTDGTILDVHPDSVNFPNLRDDRGIYQSDNLTESDIGKNLTEISGALEAVKSGYITEVETIAVEYAREKYNIETRQIMLLLMLTGNTVQQALASRVWAWIQTVLSEYLGRLTTIQAAETVPEIFAVSDDFVSFDATNPNIGLSTIFTASE